MAPADQPESTPVTPPTIDPTRWEDFEGFRETFLLSFTRKDANEALRTVATLLYDLCLESGPFMPDHPEGSARAQVRAVVADLRFLQGFLASLTEGAEGTSMEPYEEHLFRFAGKRANQLRFPTKVPVKKPDPAKQLIVNGRQVPAGAPKARASACSPAKIR